MVEEGQNVSNYSNNRLDKFREDYLNDEDDLDMDNIESISQRMDVLNNS